MLNRLISYCVNHYHKDGNCASCANHCYSNDLDHSCYPCIKYIHRNNTTDRHYDCPNLIYNYVIKHAYRYASEIAYAIEYLSNFESVKHYQLWKVWSIGCGPCSEYFGLRYATEHIRIFQNKTIDFTGFDFNHSWNDVQNFIKESLDNNLKIENKNCFEHEDAPNLIILNYMLSDLCKRSTLKEVRSFMLSLCFKIQSLDNACVIINDIDFRTFNCRQPKYALDYMDVLANKLAILKDAKYEYNISKHYFHPQRVTEAIYGEQYPHSTLLWSIPRNVQHFAPFSICNSCQLIIVKASKS